MMQYVMHGKNIKIDVSLIKTAEKLLAHTSRESQNSIIMPKQWLIIHTVQMNQVTVFENQNMTIAFRMFQIDINSFW